MILQTALNNIETAREDSIHSSAPSKYAQLHMEAHTILLKSILSSLEAILATLPIKQGDGAKIGEVPATGLGMVLESTTAK